VPCFPSRLVDTRSRNGVIFRECTINVPEIGSAFEDQNYEFIGVRGQGTPQIIVDRCRLPENVNWTPFVIESTSTVTIVSCVVPFTPRESGPKTGQTAFKIDTSSDPLASVTLVSAAQHLRIRRRRGEQQHDRARQCHRGGGRSSPSTT
jgi:hypothetical protein